MKILITNTVVLNTGDAAILFGMLKILRAAFEEEIEFIIYDKNPEIAAKYYPDLTFRRWLYLSASRSFTVKPLKRLLNLLNLTRFYFAAWCCKNNLLVVAKSILTKEELQDTLEYLAADLIVTTGGTYLVENYSLKPRIFDYRISLFFDKPLLFFTQSLGPFTLPKNRRIFKNIFEKSLLILLRDRRSKDNILNIGARDVNARVTADAAFALANASAIEAAKNIKDFPAAPNIAISVRDWKHFKTVAPDLGREKYLQAIEAATEHLVKNYGAKVTFISTCQGIPEYWTDDSKVALEIIKSLPANVADSVNLKEEFHSPQELAEILKSFDLVISTRLHMAILALGVGIPVLPIAYEFKTQELFKNFVLENLVIDIEDINQQLIIDSIDSFIASINEVRQTLFPAVIREYERAWSTHTTIAAALEKLSSAKK